jgi:hypothetical protein
MPHLIVTGRIRQVTDDLAGRVNQWQAARFRKFALQMLDTLRGGDLVPWGVTAALEEEATQTLGGIRHAPRR